MSTVLLPLHLIFAGLWLGCVLTEALFERSLLGKGSAQELILARLHKNVDIFIEIPAFLAVLITGGLMLHDALSSTALSVKIGFASIAILANVYCVWLVLRRHQVACAGDWQEFMRIDHLQHKIGAVVLIGLLMALGLGIYLHAK